MAKQRKDITSSARKYPAGRHTFKTHTSSRLRFALVDPNGVPFILAHSPGLCIGHYVQMRGGIVLDDDSEEAYYSSLLRRGWSVRHVETVVTVGSEMGLTECRKVEKEIDRANSRRKGTKVQV